MRLSCIITFILLAIFADSTYAQPYIVKGKIEDTVNFLPLHYTSITLLRAEDSVLENFTRADEKGEFTTTVSKKGKYLLISAYPNFVDFVDEVNIQSNETNVGNIPMTSRTHLMKEFVFTDEYAAIKVKGDTIEYVADSFKVKDNATVEELLKKLPGLQVDKDGNIQAHGQKVEKLLVDGEEFFTDDPAVVSKSLQAKAVNKVQVFDKKSEQAEFTGIDDGETTRTVNLELKDNMKKGYFGKLKAAGGAGDNREYYEEEAMFNAFKGQRKFSAFGILANTGKLGLGWGDADKFGGINANTTVTTDGGSVITTTTGDEFEGWGGNYNGRGYPSAVTGGVHYSNKWNEKKHHLGGNYRYAQHNIESVDNTLRQNILPNSQTFTDESEKESKTAERHRVDALYEWKTDSLTELKFTTFGDYSLYQNRSDFTGSTRRGDGSILNTNERTITSEGDRERASGALYLKKKFNKDRRTLMTSISGQYENSSTDGYLYSLNNFINRIDTIDQQKINNSEMLVLAGSATYTEPITKAMAMMLTYSLNVNNSLSERSTFNKSNSVSGDAYDALDTTLSNSFIYNIVTNSGGANLNFDYDKVDFSFGASVANTAFNQEDILVDSNFSYNVVNLFPRANFRYKISKQSSFRFSYNGRTNQPNINQIQPVQDNTNPLLTVVGNADLTQEFRHSMSVRFNDYKVLSGRWIWSSINYNMTDNAITRSVSIDTTTGAQSYRYINLDGNYSVWSYIGIGKRITKLNLQVGGGGSVNLSRDNTIVNDVRNVSQYNSYTGRFTIDYETKDEKFEIGWDASTTYNDNSSDINPNAISYWSTNQEFFLQLEDLPWKIGIGSDVDWYIREKTQDFDQNNDVFLWNAYISKKFLKNDELELKAQAFDILNQNIGFNRFANNNTITQNTYNTIRQYFMLSLTWNFTKMGVGDKDAPTVGDFVN